MGEEEATGGGVSIGSGRSDSTTTTKISSRSLRVMNWVIGESVKNMGVSRSGNCKRKDVYGVVYVSST